MTHRTIADATQPIEGHRFNVMVARLMELVNATRKAIDVGNGPGPPIPPSARLRSSLAIGLSLVAPYTAEEMWERLGHQPTVAKAGWPTADPALLVATGDLRRAGAGQGAREAGRAARHQRADAAAAGAWPTPTCSGIWRVRGADGHREGRRVW